MKEFIEKLIGRLEKKSFRYFNEGYGSDSVIRETEAIQIVNELAEEQKEKLHPQIVEISEGDLICIKTNLLLHPEVLKKVQANFVKQKESGVILLDSRFDYTIVKMNKEDEE